MSISILSYNKYSESAKKLKQFFVESGVKTKIIENANFIKPSTFNIVWGSTKLANSVRSRLNIGKTLNINLCSTVTNKLDFFQYVQGTYRAAHIPKFVTNKNSVPNLFKRIGTKSAQIVCRTKLTGHSGEGIVLIDQNTPVEDIPDCKLYTEYIKKKEEFRVHIIRSADNTYYMVQRKMRRGAALEERAVNYKIRNLAGGWVYINDPEYELPARVNEYLLSVLLDLGLDFAAFDLIYNSHRDEYYILELNSSPGLGEDTLPFYAKTLLEIYTQYKKKPSLVSVDD